MVRMNRPSVKLCRRKQIHAGFAVAPQTTKVMATVCGKCLVKTKKALNLHNRVCYYNSYILSLVIVNLLLCLTNKLHHRLHTGFSTILHSFGHPLAGRGTHLLWISGTLDFPCGSAGKESTCNVGDLGSIPGLGRFPGEGKRHPLQYSCLENSMGCIVYGVTQSWTRLWLSLSGISQ